MCKNIFGGNIYVRSKFSCVSHDLCARAGTRSQLRENIAYHTNYEIGSDARTLHNHNHNQRFLLFKTIVQVISDTMK